MKKSWCGFPQSIPVYPTVHRHKGQVNCLSKLPADATESVYTVGLHN